MQLNGLHGTLSASLIRKAWWKFNKKRLKVSVIQSTSCLNLSDVTPNWSYFHNSLSIFCGMKFLISRYKSRQLTKIYTGIEIIPAKAKLPASHLGLQWHATERWAWSHTGVVLSWKDSTLYLASHVNGEKGCEYFLENQFISTTESEFL